MNEKASILLIDEDLFFLDVYARRIRGMGFDVEIATDEESAEKILNEKKCGMAVLDVLIGDIPGVEVLKRLMQRDGAEGMSFVVLTNSSHGENVKKVLDMGADGYIVKSHNTPEEVASELKKIYDDRNTQV